jgi:hypothetical protein
VLVLSAERDPSVAAESRKLKLVWCHRKVAAFQGTLWNDNWSHGDLQAFRFMKHQENKTLNAVHC